MGFKHPGTVMSPEMTFNLAIDKETHPDRKKAFQELSRVCKLGYKNRALEVVDIDWGGKGVGHEECTKDGEMSYMAALMYWCTMNEQYGMMASDILKGWSTKNKVFKGNNAPLEAAWCVCAMARAAELLKWAKSPNIRRVWSETVDKTFNEWIDKIILPVLKKKDIWGWKPFGNWHYSIICARGQLAILREDVNEWDWCIKTFKDILPKTVGFGDCPCHISETKRDVTHAQFQLGGIFMFCEMAYHQGYIDMYDDRLYEVCEYHASIMMKEVPKGITKEEIKTPYGYWNEPVWEIAFSHYSGRLGKPMPKCDMWIKTFRPERVCFQWGGGTLTHFGRSK